MKPFPLGGFAVLAAFSSTPSVMAQTAVEPPPTVAEPSPVATATPEPLPMATTMAPGHVRIFRADTPYSNIVIGQSEVADVNPMSDFRFMLTAKKLGQTTVVLTSDDGSLRRMDIHVVARTAYLREPIRVRSFGGRRGVINHVYWCRTEVGCDPDPDNSQIVSESTTVLTLPGGGQAVTTTTTPVPVVPSR